MKLKKIYLTKERCKIYINTLKSINDILILHENMEDEYIKQIYIIFQHNITNLLAKINNDLYHSKFDFKLDTTYQNKDININIDFFKEHCKLIPLQNFSIKKELNPTVFTSGLDKYSILNIDRDVRVNDFLRFMNKFNDFDTLICSLLYTFDYWKKLKNKYALIYCLEHLLFRIEDSPFSIQSKYFFKRISNQYRIHFHPYILSTDNTFPCNASALLNSGTFNILALMISLEQIEFYHSNSTNKKFFELTAYLRKILKQSPESITYIYEKYPYAIYNVVLAASEKYTIFLHKNTKSLILCFFPYLNTLTDTQFFKLLDNLKDEYFIDIYDELKRRNISSADDYISKLVLNSLNES
jgi:hypothetical protein